MLSSHFYSSKWDKHFTLQSLLSLIYTLLVYTYTHIVHINTQTFIDSHSCIIKRLWCDNISEFTVAFIYFNYFYFYEILFSVENTSTAVNCIIKMAELAFCCVALVCRWTCTLAETTYNIIFVALVAHCNVFAFQSRVNKMKATNTPNSCLI